MDDILGSTVEMSDLLDTDAKVTPLGYRGLLGFTTPEKSNTRVSTCASDTLDVRVDGSTDYTARYTVVMQRLMREKKFQSSVWRVRYRYYNRKIKKFQSSVCG